MTLKLRKFSNLLMKTKKIPPIRFAHPGPTRIKNSQKSSKN